MRNEVIPQLVEIWYKILTCGKLDLMKNCLKILPNYIDWIDISLVTSDKFANLFFNFIKSKELRNDSIECLKVIVLKGMKNIEEKYQLLVNLKLIQIINSTLQLDEDVNIFL